MKYIDDVRKIKKSLNCLIITKYSI